MSDCNLLATAAVNEGLLPPPLSPRSGERAMPGRCGLLGDYKLQQSNVRRPSAVGDQHEGNELHLDYQQPEHDHVPKPKLRRAVHSKPVPGDMRASAHRPTDPIIYLF